MFGGFKVDDAKRQCTVFLVNDPGEDGCSEPFQFGVSLTQAEGINNWPDGAERPQTFLAVSLENPAVYRVFGHREPFDANEWQRLPGNWIAVANWRQYLDLVGGE